MPMRAAFHNAALIYNPLAGRGRWRRERELARVTELLAAYGLSCTCIPTSGPASATELARREVEAGRDLIIVCGGDGTLNEVVNGMAGSAVPLALLPAGTGNVLAKELGLPWSLWHAAEYIPRGVVRRIALGQALRLGSGQAGGRYFICLAGAGADASIVNSLDQRLKLRVGMLSYWLEGFRHAFFYDFPEFDVHMGEEKFKAAQLVVGRTKNYGGPVRITRGADLFSDEFEVCVFPRCFRLVYLLYFLAQLAGGLERFPEVRFRRTRRLRAEPLGERIGVQVDGEPAGALPMEFVIVPDALSLLVPPRAVERWTT